MKTLLSYTIIVMLLLIAQYSLGQGQLPHFLEGTWKRADKNHYEHWDAINERMLKGFSYRLKDGKMRVTEYATLSVRKNKEINLAVTLKDQNAGKTINFKQTLIDTALVFENLLHDFPKRIVYKKIDAHTLQVYLSDAGTKTYGYKLHKVEDSAPDSAAAPTTSSKNPAYDGDLAKQLGADDYGMKSYQLVILKTGTHTSKDTALINTTFRGHMENINRLVKAGKLVVAGPLGKNDLQYRGIFILNVTDRAEAVQFLKSDPAIAAQLLDYEILTWYGSAALPVYLKDADKVWKEQP